MAEQATGAITKGRQPREACVNCHFFEVTRMAGATRFASGKVTTNTITGVVGEDEREMARSGNFDRWAAPDTEATGNLLGCHMGVWKEAYQPDQTKVDRYDEVVMKDRKDFCFYWPYHQGMRFEAAETLQKRRAEAREAARDRMLTLCGLWIAAIATVVTALVGIGQIIWH